MKKFWSRVVLLSVLSLSVVAARADEGMWLLPYLQQLNIKDMKAKGLKLSAQDIYRANGTALKDAIVIFGGGCTASVVSERGLVLTNHHCGYGAIQQHSSVEHDYLQDGFWAMSDKEEIPTPGLTVTFIRRIEDVSDRILSQLNDTMSEERRAECVLAAVQQIKSETQLDRKSQEVEIKDFFGGNQYLLFVKEVYRDVRLVGAPPSSIGKFGGDTDNWMWPRHTGDFSVFRIYTAPDGSPAEYTPENVPYEAPVHLSVSLKGYKPGDFSMIIGFPGSTERYKTSCEIDFTLEVDNPNRIFIRGERQELMMEDMMADEQVKIQYATKYSGSSNYWKNSIGESQGLKRLKIKDRMSDEEARFTEWVESDPARKAKYGQALNLICRSIEGMTPLRDRQQYLAEALINGVEIKNAASIVRSIFKEDRTIDTVRWDEARKNLKEFYKNYSEKTDRKIAKRMFEIVRDGFPGEDLTPSFGVIRDYYGNNVSDYVDDMYDRSLFSSEQRAEQFLEHPDVNVLVNDPAYKFWFGLVNSYNRLIDSIGTYRDDLIRGHRLYVAGLMEMNPQKKFYPDANFTMRLTYGQILPYYPQDAVFYDYYTTLEGVMQKEDPENPYEFEVPDRLKELYQQKDYGPYAEKGVMHVNFLTNNDITGGNSGSPVMNARGELIGLAFDGNWEAMSGDTVFEPELQRTICVDIRYVLFVIDKFAGDSRLIDEMTIVR